MKAFVTGEAPPGVQVYAWGRTLDDLTIEARSDGYIWRISMSEDGLYWVGDMSIRMELP